MFTVQPLGRAQLVHLLYVSINTFFVDGFSLVLYDPIGGNVQWKKSKYIYHSLLIDLSINPVLVCSYVPRLVPPSVPYLFFFLFTFLYIFQSQSNIINALTQNLLYFIYLFLYLLNMFLFFLYNFLTYFQVCLFLHLIVNDGEEIVID